MLIMHESFAQHIQTNIVPTQGSIKCQPLQTYQQVTLPANIMYQSVRPKIYNLPPNSTKELIKKGYKAKYSSSHLLNTYTLKIE